LGILKIIYFQYLIFICFGYWNQCVLGSVVLEQWTDSWLLSIFLHVQGPDMRNLIINCLWVLFLVEQNIFVGYICLLGVAIFLLQTTYTWMVIIFKSFQLSLLRLEILSLTHLFLNHHDFVEMNVASCECPFITCWCWDHIFLRNTYSLAGLALKLQILFNLLVV
jgi:hypothetical protein